MVQYLVLWFYITCYISYSHHDLWHWCIAMLYTQMKNVNVLHNIRSYFSCYTTRPFITPSVMETLSCQTIWQRMLTNLTHSHWVKHEFYITCSEHACSTPRCYIEQLEGGCLSLLHDHDDITKLCYITWSSVPNTSSRRPPLRRGCGAEGLPDRLARASALRVNLQASWWSWRGGSPQSLLSVRVITTDAG